MQKLKFSELSEIIRKHNSENNVTDQFGDKNALQCVIVYKASNWDIEYSLESRSYRFSSDNKYFIPRMIGNSIFGTSLDGSDVNVRLDKYFTVWEVDYCYIIEK